MEKLVCLKEFRVANSMAQGTLASFLGVSQAFVSSVEKMERPLPDDKIDRILFEGAKMKWDVSPLVPAYTRLLEAYDILNREFQEDQLCPFLPNGDNCFAINRLAIIDIRHGKAQISREIAVDICLRADTINPIWLMTGVGDKILDKHLSKTLSGLVGAKDYIPDVECFESNKYNVSLTKHHVGSSALVQVVKIKEALLALDFQVKGLIDEVSRLEISLSPHDK